MFSSNHPIPGFNRPASLYVIDAMVDVPIQLSITVTNGGTMGSARSDVRVLVLHDEYDRFEIANVTEPINPISGGSSAVVDVVFTPTYAGNHTLQIHIEQPTADDNPSNDVLNRRITVGARYWNCDTLTNWTATGEWGLNSDTSISMGSSCHAGNGDGSTYSANTVSRLNTPLLDLSDGLPSGTRTMGLTFFYTGWVVAPDEISLEARTNAGGWEELASFSPTVDDDFLVDGSNWNTFSLNSGGHTSPLIPIAPDRHLHAGSSFRWTLTSNASSEDIGFWFDETVLVYDQAARADAYGLTVTGLGTQGAVPGGWGEVNLRVTNSGNISTTVRPALNGLPASWNSYTLFFDGSSVPSAGFNLLPGASRDLKVNIQPDQNASVGFTSLTFNASTDHPNVHGTAPIGFTVLADRIPVLHQPSMRPSCAPEQTCGFSIRLSNDGAGTDVFDLMLDTSTLLEGWGVDFAWSQDESVLVRPGEMVDIDLLLSVPSGAPADTTSSFRLAAVAQNDSNRVSMIDVDAVALMISDITMQPQGVFLPLVGGSTSSLTVDVENKATRMDVLNFEAEFDDPGTAWVVVGLSRDQAVLGAGTSTSIRIDVFAPTNAKVADASPRIRLVAHSERSGMSMVSGWFDGPDVLVVNGATLERNDGVVRVTPLSVTDVPVFLNSTSNAYTEVDVSIVGLPSEWTWWTKLNDVNASSPFAIAPEGESGSHLLAGIAILAPISEPAGTSLTARIVATLDGSELASVDVDLVVMTVRTLGLVIEPADRDISSGAAVAVAGRVVNEGNAPEPNLLLHVDVQSTPPLEGLLVFVSTSTGTEFVVGGANPLALGAGSEKSFTVDLVVPDDAPLGARIVVNVRLEGRVDLQGSSNALAESHLFEVASRRELLLEVEPSTYETVPFGQSVPFVVHLSSSSSFAEDLSVMFRSPDGWSVVCDGFGDVTTGLDVPLDAGHIVVQERILACSVVQGDGPSQGHLDVELYAAEPLPYAQANVVVAWNLPEPENGGVSATVLYGGASGVGVVLLIVAMNFMARRRADPGQVVADESKATSTAVHPSSPSPAPPASIVTPTQAIPLPAEGLPPGWSMEQWEHYGHQWMAQHGGQG